MHTYTIYQRQNHHDTILTEIPAWSHVEAVEKASQAHELDSGTLKANLVVFDPHGFELVDTPTVEPF